MNFFFTIYSPQNYLKHLIVYFSMRPFVVVVVVVVVVIVYYCF